MDSSSLVTVNEPAGPLVRIAALSKLFRNGGTETHALRDVGFEIRQGEFVAISGPSGCGKSTLLSILGLLDSPTRGEYYLRGERVESLGPDERAALRGRDIGFIFQAFNLIGHLTACENVEVPLEYRGIRETERQARVWEALERVGMIGRMNHYPVQLSGGEQQRVAVARAIAGGPVLLLADEPTGNLDSANGDAVMSLLDELHEEGATIVMVTHDPRYAHRAERTLHLLDGQIVGEDRASTRRRPLRKGVDP